MNMIDDYGGKNWKKLWYKLEQDGNVGIDYVINPYLYPKMSDVLRHRPGSTVVDFGAGTNILAIQFLYGYQSAVPGLKGIADIEEVRKHIDEFTGLEGAEQLVEKGRNYLKDLGFPGNIDIQHWQIGKGRRAGFLKKKSVTLAVSRNFIMHLDEEDLGHHLAEVSDILKDDGEYVVAFLNPEYEQGKHLDLHPGRPPLKSNEKYSFAHGSHGEHGIFYHYWKDIRTYEASFAKHFVIKEKVPCVPLTDIFQEEYPRYYQKNIPMAFLYTLTK